MDTPRHCDPYNPQCPYPFHPGHYPYSKPCKLQSDQRLELPKTIPTWRLFASCVKTPLRWSISCPMPSKKTMKIPSQHCLPTLPKGWAYKDIEGKVKQEVLNDLMSLSLACPATTLQYLSLIGPVRGHWLTSRSMRETEPFPLPSATSSGVQCQCAISRST